MTIPGLALFYGGLVRSKNVLSVLTQVFLCFSMVAILWVIYGYSVAFTNGTQFFGGLSKFFLAHVDTSTMAMRPAPGTSCRTRRCEFSRRQGSIQCK